MGKVQKVLDERITSFIQQQKCFFVASAALSADEYVNTSPKGYETFAILGENEVCYLDYPGSGNETARHIEENGRLTIMFCSFDETPMIVRLYGQGEVVDKDSERFHLLAERFPARKGQWTRQIIVLRIEQVKTSCGESVPHYEYKGEREQLHEWAVNMDKKGKLAAYIENHK
jgi:hypothetical protein